MSDGQIKSYFDRWQRLEEAKAEISEDLKELFAEAKSFGFDTKAMRVAFRQKVKAENETNEDREFAAIVDLYLSEIDAPRARPAPAHEKTLKNFGSYADAKLVETVAQGVQTETGRKALVAAIGTMIEREEADPITGEILESGGAFHAASPSEPAESSSDAISAGEAAPSGLPVNQPETAERTEPAEAAVTVGNDLRKPVAAGQGQIIREGDAPRETGRHDGGAASCPDNDSNPQKPTSSQVTADKAETAPPPVVSAAFNNPRCREPKSCPSAHSRTACFDCVMAWAERPKDEQVRLWQEAIGAAA